MTGPVIQAADAFVRQHGYAPTVVWSAPGRVNLIGEHTDYNDGLALPLALPHRAAVAAAPRTDGMLNVATVSWRTDGAQSGGAWRSRLLTSPPVAVADLAPGVREGWATYPLGVAWVLRDAAVAGAVLAPGGGADLIIASDVPIGAGLSSSHAVQCATALALLGLVGHEPGKPDSPTLAEVARWVQLAENEFAGVPTGLLDQTASLCCQAGHALLLDVRAGSVEQVPFAPMDDGLRLLAIDTQTRHSLGNSAYRDRRAGCEAAAAALGVAALRDVPTSWFEDPGEEQARLDRVDPAHRPLVRHIVTENDRVTRTVEALRAGQLGEIGPLLTASHESLRDDYRVSCAELDVAVEAALGAGALGARMTGGGFGGSAIALVDSNRTDEVRHAVDAAYTERGWRAARVFDVEPSAGAGRDR